MINIKHYKYYVLVGIVLPLLAALMYAAFNRLASETSIENNMYQTLKTHTLPSLDDEKTLLDKMSQRYGFILVYQGNQTASKALIKQVMSYHRLFHFAVVGVCLDGAVDFDLPKNILDSGQSNWLKVTKAPALFVYSAKTKQVVNVCLHDSNAPFMFRANLYLALTKLNHLTQPKAQSQKG